MFQLFNCFYNNEPIFETACAVLLRFDDAGYS